MPGKPGPNTADDHAVSRRALKVEHPRPRALRDIAEARSKAAQNRAKHIFFLCNLPMSGTTSSTRY
jgi:hypothetical protein